MTLFQRSMNARSETSKSRRLRGKAHRVLTAVREVGRRRLALTTLSACLALMVNLSCGLLAGWAQDQSRGGSAKAEMEAGKMLFQEGKFPQAVLRFDRVAKLYEEQGKKTDQAQALIYLAEALHQVGWYDQGMASMRVALDLAKQEQDQPLMAVVLGRMGNTSMVRGNMAQAEEFLKQGLAVARQAQSSSLAASLLNDLGNVLATQERYSDALAAYTESTILADGMGNQLLALSGLINAARVAMKEGKAEEAIERLDVASTRVPSLPDSHENAHALINMGLAYREMMENSPATADRPAKRAEQSFQQAATIAEGIDDQRMISFAWGYLGQIYEHERHWEEALTVTRRATLAAQQSQALDSLYQWEWQTGRLLHAMNQPADAIAAYQRAITALQPIRHEMSSEFFVRGQSFRERLGPLFTGLADLLLQQAALPQSSSQEEALLRQARDTVEMFKANELQDYFGDDCVQTAQQGQTIVDAIGANTAVIYPIMLPDRLELLVSMGKQLKRFAVPVNQSAFVQEVRTFRRLLEKRTTRQYLPHAKQLYEWMVKPLEGALAEKGITTLVFVPDGPLRTIPLAPLHDGRQFLIEKYAVALTPGLKLTDPHPIDRSNLKILSVGLTQSVHGFSALPYVENELDDIRELFGGSRLVDQEFILPALEHAMKQTPFTVVHIASHGQFSQDVDKTFVLAFDGEMTMDQLDQLIGLYQFRDQPLDLLTLSACQTAAGNDQAALGLAGVAIKAGARSALATLWFINDKSSSDLVTEFYRQLKDPAISKAVAMQRAQMKLLQDPVYQHPGYWAPFLLLNNWL